LALRIYLQARNWPVAAGYLLFTGMMAAGYFYNVTFVQLGLKDLGERVLGLSPATVARYMAVLALATCMAALATGYGMRRWAWSRKLLTKLQLALAVVAVNTVLTAVAPMLRTSSGFLTWIILCSLTLGVGVPVTFSLTTDLIPVADRGYVAAAITAAAYFLAAVFSSPWQIGPLAERMLLVMVPGTLGLGLIVLLATVKRTFVAGWVQELSQNHRRARFARGRFLREHEGNQHAARRRFWFFVALMSGIFFIDSLGFLRLVDTPMLVTGAWRAPELSPRLVIGGVHVVAALVAGVLYTHLSERQLFFWIFGLFTLTHFSYALSVWLLPETTIRGLGTPMLYATAVSLYTVINFALWADFATPETISLTTAVGVAISGWAATFLSTALAMQWQTSGVSLSEHLRRVESLALVFFLFMLLAGLWPHRGNAGLPKRGDE
jgi:MFS family permease